MLTIFEQNTLKKVTRSFIDQVRTAIQTKDIARRSRGRGEFRGKVNASGKLAASVIDEVSDDEILVTAFSYVDSVIFGQPPGTVVEPRVINKWLEDKGLSLATSSKSIARNIFNYGTSIWQKHQGKDSGLFADVNIQPELDEAMKALAQYNVSKVADDIFNKLAA